MSSFKIKTSHKNYDEFHQGQIKAQQTRKKYEQENSIRHDISSKKISVFKFISRLLSAFSPHSMQPFGTPRTKYQLFQKLLTLRMNSIIYRFLMMAQKIILLLIIYSLDLETGCSSSRSFFHNKIILGTLFPYHLSSLWKW